MWFISPNMMVIRKKHVTHTNIYNLCSTYICHDCFEIVWSTFWKQQHLHTTPKTNISPEKMMVIEMVPFQVTCEPCMSKALDFARTYASQGFASPHAKKWPPPFLPHERGSWRGFFANFTGNFQGYPAQSTFARSMRCRSWALPPAPGAIPWSTEIGRLSFM